MNILSKFWNNFKVAPDVWFFYGFLLTFTLSVRKVLVFYPIAGQFNEWTGIYLYLSDILLVIALFLWIISILRNKNTNLSTTLESSKLQDIFLTGLMDNIYLWLKQAKIYLPLLLVVWSFISIFWSENQNIALFKALKLLEFYLLYLFIIFRFIPLFHMEQKYKCHPELDSGSNQNRFRIKSGMTMFFSIIIALGFIQAIIGIGQFIIQHSVGLFWLKESLISPDITGVAKIVLSGEKFIRAYGLFPHPNILGGFLLVSIILTWAYFSSVLLLPRRGIKGGVLKISLIFQIIALILTFSKSAILGLIIAIIYIFWKKREIFHLSSFLPLLRGGNKGGVVKITIIIATIFILSLYLAGLNLGENLEKSYGDRMDQLAIWKSVAQNNLLLGVGSGNYMFRVEHLYPNLETWQYQPIHNVFWLILSELGIVGVFIFVWFLWKLFHSRRNVPYGTSSEKDTQQPCHSEWSGAESKNLISQNSNLLDPSITLGMTFKSILLAFIFIMLFDHYLWDIQQGQIMLWLILGFVTGIAAKK